MSAEKVPESLCETCSACGHLNEDGEHRCEKCGRRLDDPPRCAAAEARSGEGAGNPHLRSLRATREPTPGGPRQIPIPRQADARRRSPAFPEPLRRQLRAQVREFRSRRLRPTLPFPHGDESPPSGKVIPIAARPAVPNPRRTTSAPYDRTRRSRVVPELQAPLKFPALAAEALAQEGPVSRSDSFLPALAPLHLRVLGNCLDFALILAAVLAFLTPLKLLAGEVVFNRFLLVGGLAAGLVLALLYGGLFLYLAGATPAMRCVGLRLVNFDGQPASRPERLWRFLGAIASAGSFLLGFVWAAVDDERFSWHDRISKTFLTPTTR